MLRRDSPTRVPRASLLLIAAAVLVGCGDTSAEDEREQLADDLVAETGGALDEETARCVADALHEEFGGDSFEQVIDAARDDGGGDVRTQVIDIFSGCDALGPIIDDAP